MNWAGLISKLGQFLAAPKSMGLAFMIRAAAEIIARIIKKYYDEKAKTRAIYEDARKKAAIYAAKIIGKKTTTEERRRIEEAILNQPDITRPIDNELPDNAGNPADND